MILFTPDNVPKILSGQKTQTRRCWKRPRAKVGSFHWAQLNYAPESRFARLEILDVWEQAPEEISEANVKAEGFTSKTGFLAAYDACNPNYEALVASGERRHFVIDFRVVDICASDEIARASLFHRVYGGRAPCL